MGEPAEIYKNPKTPFVAQFIGESTLIHGYDKLNGFENKGGDDAAIIRPEFVKVIKQQGNDEYVDKVDDSEGW